MSLDAATQAPPPPDNDLLGLTVHSLPPAQQAHAALDDAQRSRMGRIKMFLVLLVCAAPVIASYFTYYVIRPEGRRNFGELVNKQPTIPAVQAQTLDGQPFDLQSLQGQWLLVSASGAACDAVCQNNLYLQRQLREMLGEQGLQLAHADVGQHSDPRASDSSAHAGGTGDARDGGEPPPAMPAPTAHTLRLRGLLDAYA